MGWPHETRGSRAYWLATLVFILVGVAFAVVGALTEKVFLFIGIPFLCIGTVLLALLIYSLHLKARDPENYGTWLWWVNFVGGLCGALLFSIPSTLALPMLLLAGVETESLWLGALFSAVGVAVTVAVWLVARRQYGQRPRWVSGDDRPTTG